MRGLFDDITVRKLCTENIFLKIVDSLWRYFGFYRCVKCNRPLYQLCCTCRVDVRFSVSSLRDYLESNSSTCQLPRHFSAFGYTKVIKRLFAVYKFQYAKQYQRMIETLLTEYASVDPFGIFRQLRTFILQHNGGVILLPVPMTRRKFEERGFSPATEMAVMLGRILLFKGTRNALIGDKLIKKVKETAPQSRKNRKARLLSIYRAFSIDEAGVSELCRLTPALLIIVDDIYTTGATVTEVYETLVRAKVFELLPKMKIISFSFAQSERIIR